MSNPVRKKKKALSEGEKQKKDLQEDIEQLKQDLESDNNFYDSLKTKNMDIEANIIKAKEYIHDFNKAIEDYEQQQEFKKQNAGFIPDDGGEEDGKKGENTRKQKERKFAERMVKKQKIEMDLDRKVKNEIETYCNRVIYSHIDKLDENNMEYNVYHMKKKAVFRLGSKDDTFGFVKEKIADYFGLPVEKIFLMNDRDQILL